MQYFDRLLVWVFKHNVEIFSCVSYFVSQQKINPRFNSTISVIDCDKSTKCLLDAARDSGFEFYLEKLRLKFVLIRLVDQSEDIKGGERVG